MSEWIEITYITHTILKLRKHETETYDDVIRRIIEENHELKEKQVKK